MPAFNSYAGIKRKLLEDIPAIWTGVRKIYFGMPVIPPKQYPYVVVTMAEGPLRTEPFSVKGYMQFPSFQITKVAVMPADKTINVLDLQVSECNSLIERLEAAETYGDDGSGNPVIQDQIGTAGPFTDPMTDDRDHVYETTIQFAGRVVEYHSSFTP